MKYHSWNNDKNEKLKKERNISFEDVIYYIENEKLHAILKHKNQERYPGQKIYAVEINNYIYLVPFVEIENEIFLKTIIPSRKATKKYLEVRDEK
ncbi:MAG: BrnT family toxin [Candidatus Humimicrobiaceae bacterium]